jgi:hypothetical protein
VLAVSFVAGLAALVRMASPGPFAPAGPTSVIRLPAPVTAIVIALFVLAALVFLLCLRRRLARRGRADVEGEAPAAGPPTPRWVRALAQVLSLVYLLAIAYLVWRGAIPLADIMALGYGAASGIGATLSGPPPPSAPPAVTWTFAILALAAGTGALALALWVAFGDRLTRWWDASAGDPPTDPLAEAVGESVEDLLGEPDARRAIIRCYARFERVARAFQIERRPWWTPAEFMREALDRRRLPPAAVETLTGLFELARFSHHPLGPAERSRALRALDEIGAAVEEGQVDAAPR